MFRPSDVKDLKLLVTKRLIRFCENNLDLFLSIKMMTSANLLNFIVLKVNKSYCLLRYFLISFNNPLSYNL